MNYIQVRFVQFIGATLSLTAKAVYEKSDAAKVDMNEYYENNKSPIKLSEYYEQNKDAKKLSLIP